MWDNIVYWINHNYTTISVVLTLDSMVVAWLNYMGASMNNRLSFSSPAMLAIPIFGMSMEPEYQKLYLVCIGAMLAGCVFRFGLMYGKNELSWKKAIEQFMTTIPLCLLSYWIWAWSESKYPIHIVLFGVSFFSMFIAYLLDKFGKISLTELLAKGARALAAKIEDKP